MIALSPAMLAQSQAVQNVLPFLWLYEITIDTTTVAQTMMRLVRHDATVAFGSDTYYPFPIGHTEIVEDDQRNLPGYQIVLSHASRELARYLETGRGMRGASVRMILTHLGLAAAADAVRTHVVYVQSVIATEKAVTLDCGLDVLADREFPAEQLTRDRCPLRYGSEQCGVRLTASMLAAFPSCPKTWVGCDERGDQEQLEGYAKMHPRRYGGYPGIPRAVRT